MLQRGSIKPGKEKLTKNTCRLHSFIIGVGTIPTVQEFKRTAWIPLNRLCTALDDLNP